MPQHSRSHSPHPTPWFARSRAFRSLEHRNWRKLWFGSLFWHLPFWMDHIILGWVVLLRTDSPILVALVGASRLLPMGTIGFFAGVQADRWPRKRLLIGAQSVNFMLSSIMAVTLYLDVLDLWHIYLGAFLIGGAWATDFPVRHSLIRDVVPEHSVVNAMALNAASMMGSAMVGRWLAGSITDVAGPGAAYGFIALSLLVGLSIVIRVPVSPRESPESRPQRMGRGILEGLGYAWRNAAIRGVMIVTVAANFLIFPATQLHPVFARNVFGVGATGLGFMSGMDGLGSLVGAMTIAMVAGDRHRGHVLLIGSMVLGTGVLLFSFAPSYGLALPPLLLSGLGSAGFATMQTAIPATAAAPAMRGRALGAVALAIGVLPLGMVCMGSLAEWLGAPRAVTYSCIAFLLLILLTAASQPGLRKVAQHEKESSRCQNRTN